MKIRFGLFGLALLLFFGIFNLSSCNKRRIKKDGCDTAPIILNSDTCYFILPNIFTPNSDGINDLFRPEFNCALTNYKLTVDRKGVVYFETNDPNEGWDGRRGADKVRQDFYNYTLFVNFQGTNISETRTVTILRDVDILKKIDNCEQCYLSQTERVDCQ